MHMSVKPGGGRVVKWFRGLRQIHVVYMTLGSITQEKDIKEVCYWITSESKLSRFPYKNNF